MNPALVYVNGKILPAEAPAISALDAGLQGVGIYETLSVLRGKPLFLREHLERMEASRRWMEFPTLPWDIAQAVSALLARAGTVDAGLRITLTMGTAQGPSLILALRPIPSLPSPLRLWISSQRKWIGDPWESVKTISRVRNAKAREEAIANGAFEALLPTNEGDLAEGSVSNLFLVRDEMLLTPPLNRGCLPGVTRDKILASARGLGVALQEIPIFPQDLPKAEEVLISNALIGLCPSEEVIGHWTRGKKAVNPLVGRLRERYRKLVDEDLRLPSSGA